MKKKNVYQGLAAISVSILTMVILSPRGVRLGNLLDEVEKSSFLLLAAFSFLCFILMEAWTFTYILRLQKVRVPIPRTYGYSLVDYFFSSLSPGGSAGQPAQLYYMARDQVGVAPTMMSLVAFNALYHLAMVIFALVSQISLHKIFAGLSLEVKLVMAWGILTQLGLTVIQIALMISQERVPKLVKGFMKKMRDWKIPYLKNIQEEKVDQTMEQYKDYGAYFKKERGKLIPVFLGNVFLLIFSYSISYFVYRSLGYRDLPYWRMIGLQSQLVLATESLPLPGGVGASEHIFYQVYQAQVPQGAAFTWMILTRALTYYFGLALGLISVFILSARPYHARKIESEEKSEREVS